MPLKVPQKEIFRALHWRIFLQIAALNSKCHILISLGMGGRWLKMTGRVFSPGSVKRYCSSAAVEFILLWGECCSSGQLMYPSAFYTDPPNKNKSHKDKGLNQVSRNDICSSGTQTLCLAFPMEGFQSQEQLREVIIKTCWRNTALA